MIILAGRFNRETEDVELKIHGGFDVDRISEEEYSCIEYPSSTIHSRDLDPNDELYMVAKDLVSTSPVELLSNPIRYLYKRISNKISPPRDQYEMIPPERIAFSYHMKLEKGEFYRSIKIQCSLLRKRLRGEKLTQQEMINLIKNDMRARVVLEWYAENIKGPGRKYSSPLDLLPDEERPRRVSKYKSESLAEEYVRVWLEKFRKDNKATKPNQIELSDATSIPQPTWSRWLSHSENYELVIAMIDSEIDATIELQKAMPHFKDILNDEIEKIRYHKLKPTYT